MVSRFLIAVLLLLPFGPVTNKVTEVVPGVAKVAPVVEAVGASPSVQASFATEQSSTTSAACANVESLRLLPEKTGSPVIATNFTSSRLMVGNNVSSSSVSPL